MTHLKLDEADVATGGRFRANSVQGLENLIETVWGDNAPLFSMSQWEHPETEQMLDKKRYRYIRQVLSIADNWMTGDALASALGSPTDRMYPEMQKKVDNLVEVGDVEKDLSNDVATYRLKAKH